jgi:hypothetical protein
MQLHPAFRELRNERDAAKVEGSRMGVQDQKGLVGH